jgi:molybdenum cofactor cytidylyltransferase
MTTKRIAGLLLAAGESARLGQPKQLLEWRGVPLIEHAARTALCAGLDPVVVVIGCRAEDMRAALESPVTIVENPDWQVGMSTSLRAGLRAMPGDVDAAIMLLVDQPRLSEAHLRAMIDTYERLKKPVVVSAYRGRRTSPSLFDRSLFEALMRLTGDTGGRSIIDANLALVEMVEVNDELTLFDVDTPEDWQRLTAQSGFSLTRRLADTDLQGTQ